MLKTFPQRKSGQTDGAFGVESLYRTDRIGSSSGPSLNGHLHYPNDIDRSLNEAAADKIRKYRADYNNNPPNSISRAVSFMPTIASVSGRLHSEFIRLLFLQAHRETDRFFAVSGAQLTEPNSGFFHFRRVAFSSKLKAKVGLTKNGMLPHIKQVCVQCVCVCVCGGGGYVFVCVGGKTLRLDYTQSTCGPTTTTTEASTCDEKIGVWRQQV